MIGSIIGDIVGSTFEFVNIKTKEYPLFPKGSEFTDDSILSFATADWLLHGGNAATYYCGYAMRYPNPMGGYGSSFKGWVVRASRQGDFSPYNSCGNGSAMRVGPVGWAFEAEAEVLDAARLSAACTHNHPEGIKGAQATALCIFMARKGASKAEIQEVVEKRFNYDLSMTTDELRPRYSWQGIDGKGNGGICQESVPQAIRAFIDGNDFEDCVRNAISIGGDSDTIGCITGSIAEAFYGVPDDLRNQAQAILTPDLLTVLTDFEAKYGKK